MYSANAWYGDRSLYSTVSVSCSRNDTAARVEQSRPAASCRWESPQARLGEECGKSKVHRMGECVQRRRRVHVHSECVPPRVAGPAAA
jgi:hypothetical protein